MGNANGREEGVENGGGGANGVTGGANNASTVRVTSADSMASSPPHDHRQSATPSLFSSQDPVISLHRNHGSSFSPLQQNESQQYNDDPPEQGIPTIITWSFGGKNVTVEGSWDNWKTKNYFRDQARTTPFFWSCHRAYSVTNLWWMVKRDTSQICQVKQMRRAMFIIFLMSWVMFLITSTVLHSLKLPHHQIPATAKCSLEMKNLGKIPCWFHLNSNQVFLAQKTRK